MSYSSARSNVHNATQVETQQAIALLAEAIRALSRAVEQDIAKLKQEISRLK